MGHLNSYSASGVGNLNKNFPEGMFKLQFDDILTRGIPCFIS